MATKKKPDALPPPGFLLVFCAVALTQWLEPEDALIRQQWQGGGR
jgi:hypothetical protein